METMKIKLEPWAQMPTRAHAEDAGLDLYSPIDFTLEPYGHLTIDTGVHIQLPVGTVGLVKSRSGMMVHKGITTDGVIDEGYTGTIGVCLINNSDRWHDFFKGDKIAQLVILKCEKPEIVVVNDLDASDRGENGFGSTGK